MKAIIDALNVVYDEEEKRSFVKLNAVSLAFTLGHDPGGDRSGSRPHLLLCLRSGSDDLVIFWCNMDAGLR